MAKFIVFEGIAGSGITTLSKKLATHLNAVWMCEPTYSAIGRLLRKALREQVGPYHPATLANLFQADRIEHVSLIKKMLNDNIDVVCDRYILSTIVYQSLCSTWSKSKNAMRKMHTRMYKHDKEYLIFPDITFILDLDADQAFKRSSRRDSSRALYDKLNTQKILRKLYLEHFKLYPKQTAILDGSKSISKNIDECLNYF